MGEECLQYGACLRGEPIGRYPKEPVKHSRGVNQDHRGGAVKGWLEMQHVPFDLAGEKKGEGTFQRSSQDNSGLTGEETSVEAPKKLVETLHESGKANGSEEKVGKEPSSSSASFPGTIGTQTGMANVMLWEKAHVHDLGKAHLEVISSPTSLYTNYHVVTELLGSVDECLPSFEGQRRMGDQVAKDLYAFEGHVGTNEILKHRFPQQATLDAPSFEISSGPYIEGVKASLLTDSTKSSSQHKHFLKQNNHMTHGPMLADISNHQSTRQGSSASGSKWSLVLHYSPGSKEVALAHAGQKRAFEVASDQIEAPNKKYIVSQDDNENSKFLTTARSQPCQGL